MKQFDSLMFSVKLRKHYKGRELKPTVVEHLDGKIFQLFCMYLQGPEDKYPGEYALVPIKENPRQWEMFEDAGITWISSGDCVQLDTGKISYTTDSGIDIDVPQEFLQEYLDMKLSADRWDAFIKSDYLSLYGYAGDFEKGIQHFGVHVEADIKQQDKTKAIVIEANELAVKVITNYADTIIKKRV